MFLIAAIVHVEAIPGVRQDWLVRPIRRGNLLLEKFLFVVLVVEGPIFAANLFQGLANGFSWPSTLLSATSYVIFLLFFSDPAALRFCLSDPEYDGSIHSRVRMYIHHGRAH